MSPPAFAVVLVAWNSAGALGESIGALRRSASAAGVTVEIVVVDNASSDGSARIAKEAGADTVLRNPLNGGYVVAAAQGMAVAQGEWIMLANPDLAVTEGFVAAVVEAIGSAPPDVAGLAPDTRYAADPDVVNSRGLEVDWIGIPSERDAGRAADEVDVPEEAFGPTTSGCLLRRSAVEDVGGFEPVYFAYLEDVDLAWRLRKRGYRTLVVRDAVALHAGSASTREGSWLKAFLVARNRRVFFRLHAPSDMTARLFRSVTEVGHATVQSFLGGGTAPLAGRVAALGTRRYTDFLRASYRAAGLDDGHDVALAPRLTLRENLRRKLTTASLMRRGANPLR